VLLNQSLIKCHCLYTQKCLRCDR